MHLWQSRAAREVMRVLSGLSTRGRSIDPIDAFPREVEATAPSERRADAPPDLAIVLDHLAEVAAEAVLVELLAGLRVPQPAAVRRELVAEHQRAVRVLRW